MTDAAPEPRPAEPQPAPRRRRPLATLLLVLLLFPPASVIAYWGAYAPVTALMVERVFEGEGFSREWRSLDRISPNLAYAVIAAEDSRFCSHHGFDLEAIEKALRHNERRPGRIRGGSTISQQTAKNAFLWSGRGWVRKGLEAGYTAMIEVLWGKRRIMEVYLNVVEWGPGVYGAQAASRRWFGVDADRLTPRQAAALAAILPSPRKWKAADGGPYVRRRVARIAAAMGTVRSDGLASCVGGPAKAEAPRPASHRPGRRAGA